MMYVETIVDNFDLYRIERQKNTPTGSWYGLSLNIGLAYPKTDHDVILADNETYIINTLYPMLKEDPDIAVVELNIPLKAKDRKILRKLIRKADKLGWFDEVKVGHSVTKF